MFLAAVIAAGNVWLAFLELKFLRSTNELRSACEAIVYERMTVKNAKDWLTTSHYQVEDGIEKGQIHVFSKDGASIFMPVSNALIRFENGRAVRFKLYEWGVAL